MYETIKTLICMSFSYICFQTGDFYYYFTLPEPYQTLYMISDVSIRFWLLVNGIFNIQIAFHFFSYHFYFIIWRTRGSEIEEIEEHPHCKHVEFLHFMVFLFGSFWTSIGLIGLFRYMYEDQNVFWYYLIVKVSLQTIFYFMYAAMKCRQ